MNKILTFENCQQLEKWGLLQFASRIDCVYDISTEESGNSITKDKNYLLDPALETLWKFVIKTGTEKYGNFDSINLIGISTELYKTELIVIKGDPDGMCGTDQVVQYSIKSSCPRVALYEIVKLMIEEENE